MNADALLIRLTDLEDPGKAVQQSVDQTTQSRRRWSHSFKPRSHSEQDEVFQPSISSCIFFQRIFFRKSNLDLHFLKQTKSSYPA